MQVFLSSSGSFAIASTLFKGNVTDEWALALTTKQLSSSSDPHTPKDLIWLRKRAPMEMFVGDPGFLIQPCVRDTGFTPAGTWQVASAEELFLVRDQRLPLSAPQDQASCVPRRAFAPCNENADPRCACG
jgi:hypothetical protein